MPWATFEKNGEYCVYKLDADTREKTGESLGCHASREKAQAQVAALYANADEKSMKLGARHSDSDRKLIQGIHDRAGEISQAALDLGHEVEEVLDLAKTLISFGGEVKALANGHFGGYLIRFTDAADTDLAGDYFDARTDFGFAESANSPVYLNHRQPLPTKDGKSIVLRDSIGEATLTRDTKGILIDALLYNRSEYEKEVIAAGKQNLLGWSSGTAAYLVDRQPQGKAKHIVKWPLGLDASLTPGPSEPRNQAIPLKSYAPVSLDWPGRAEPDGSKVKAGAGTTVTVLDSESEDMAMDNEILTALAEQGQQVKALTESVEKLLKHAQDAPAIKSSGYISDDGGAKDKEVKSFGDFLMALRRGDVKRLTTVYKTETVNERDEVKALGEASGTVGGYLVPDQFIPQLYQVAAEEAIVRSRAFIRPMMGRTATLPVLDQTTAPTAGNTAFYGGLVAGWSEEAAAITEREPKFRSMQLTAWKLAGYTKADSELREDSAVALEQLLLRLFGGAIGWYEDYAFLRGNGVGKPLGVENAAASISVTRVAAGADFELADARTMLKRLVPSSHKRAVWVVHPFIIDSLLQLSATNTVIAWAPDVTKGAPATLYGLPVLFSEKMAASGTAFDVALVDWSYYVIGDRRMLEIAFSEHAFFTNDQVAWRFTHRVDGQPWLNAAITLADATNTVSAYVYLT